MEADYFVERNAYAEEASDYEFDAPQFYDFTRTELDSEIEEAERWFEVSGDYPSAPFIVKVNLEKLMAMEAGSNSSNQNCCSDTRVSGANDQPKGKIPQAAAHVQTGSDHKLLPTPSFMKPTTTSLSKQLVNHNHSGHIFTRSKVSNSSSQSESQKHKLCNFKARPLNKKILEPRLPLQPKKSPPPLPDFHVFHLKTMERANHRASSKEKLVSVEIGSSSSKEKCTNTMSIGSSSDNGSPTRASGGAKNNDKGKSYTTPQAAATVKMSSDDKLHQSRSPSFMQPTASNLAKQKVNHNHSAHIFTRLEKISAKAEQKGSQSSIDSNLATKRQKLDIGYMEKVSHLEPQFLLMHKSPKKVTIPKDPRLETMLRAQRKMSKVSNASTTESESQKQKLCNFKARPLNKKILEPRLPLQPKKSPPPLPDFHVFNLKTMERANHRASAKEKLISVEMGSNSSKEKCSNAKVIESSSSHIISDQSTLSYPAQIYMKTYGASQVSRGSSVKASVMLMYCDYFVERGGGAEASDYEFDAPQFYDFTRKELDCEIEEAERWFEVSGNYPPFIVKVNLEKLMSLEVGSNSSKENCETISSSSDNGSPSRVSGAKDKAKGKSYITPQEAAEVKKGSDDKLLRSPSFMKPTTSSLAKQKVNHNHSGHIFTRSKVSNASSKYESQKQKFCNFKARPLNRKIMEPRLALQPKKSPPALPDFHVSNLKTMERANHHASVKEKLISVDIGSNSSKQKCSNTKSIGSSSDNGSPSRVSCAKNNDKGKSYTTPQAAAKAKTSSDDKLQQSRCPSFMKTTASNLAKQKVNHNHSGHIFTRLQKISAKVEQKGSQSSSDSNLVVANVNKVFNLKTMERGNHHASAKEKLISVEMGSNSSKEKCSNTKSIEGSSSHIISDKTTPSYPSQIYMKTNEASQSSKGSSVKGQKKDDNNPFQAELRRCNPRPKQCGDQMRRFHEAKCLSHRSTYRSLGIS